MRRALHMALHLQRVEVESLLGDTVDALSSGCSWSTVGASCATGTPPPKRVSPAVTGSWSLPAGC